MRESYPREFPHPVGRGRALRFSRNLAYTIQPKNSKCDNLHKFVGKLAPELDVPVAAGGDREVGVSRDGGEGDDVAVHEALLVVVRVRQVRQVQLLELQDLEEEGCDETQDLLFKLFYCYTGLG